MYTAEERFDDAAALLSAIESRTVREGRRAFAWQMAKRARQARREHLLQIVTRTIAAVVWVATVLIVSGMMFTVWTE